MNDWRLLASFNSKSQHTTFLHVWALQTQNVAVAKPIIFADTCLAHSNSIPEAKILQKWSVSDKLILKTSSVLSNFIKCTECIKLCAGSYSTGLDKVFFSYQENTKITLSNWPIVTWRQLEVEPVEMSNATLPRTSCVRPDRRNTSRPTAFSSKSDKELFYMQTG